MIRRSPAELYIKYLCVHPKKYTNEQIEEILQFAQLDFIGNWYVNRIREKLKPPAPFFPFDRSHTASQRWLYASGLSWVFHPDKSGVRAFDILESPRVKEYVEASIASSAPSIAISHAVTQYLRFKCDSSTIDRYRYFFWNVDLVDATELRALLKFRVDRIESHKDPEIRAQYESLKQAYYKDARKTAAELPFSPVGALLTQMRMGILPSEIDIKNLRQKAENLSLSRSFESMFINGPGDSKRSLDYATVFEKVVTIGKEMADPQEQMRDQIASITMRTDDAPLPNIHTLSLGKHTVEVARMETTDELPADFDDGDGGEEPSIEPG